MTAQRPPATFRTVRNMRLLYAVAVAANVFLFLPVWVVYLTDTRDIALGQVGLLEAFFSAVAVTAEVPTGAFSDRFGRRLTFGVGLAVQGAGLTIFGLATGYPLILLSYVLWALGQSFYSGNASAYLYETLAAEGREGEFAAAIGRVTAVEAGATVAGSIAGAALAALTDLQTPIVLSGAVFAAGLPAVLLMQEPPRGLRGVSERRLSYVETLREGARALRRNRAVAYITLFLIAFAIGRIAMALLQQPFLQLHDVPIGAFGLFIAGAQVLAIGGALVAHRLPRAFGFGRTLALLVLLPAVALLLMGVADHVSAFGAFAVFAVANRVAIPLVADYINQRTPSEVRATVLSVEPLGRELLFVVLSPFYGLGAEQSLPATLTAVGALFLTAAGIAYLLWLRTERAAVRQGA